MFSALLVICGCTQDTLDKQLLNDVIEGDVIAVRAELAAGADPNVSSDGNKTALIWLAATAIASGDAAADITRALLDAGADPTARSADGSTALHWAASTGRLAMVQQLVDAGADVNATTDTGWSPLDAAEAGGDVEIVQYLIRRGAVANH